MGVQRNMGRQINPDEVKYWYDPYKLKALFLWNKNEAYAIPASKILHVGVDQAKKKINKSILSHEDTIDLAKGLGLNYKQYREIFLKGVFDEEDTPE